MTDTLSINEKINAEDLKSKLNNLNSLSEEQINEIVPEILKIINEIKDVENENTESTTKNFLLNLRQNVTNNSGVLINIKKNNINITINHPNKSNQPENPNQNTPTTNETEIDTISSTTEATDSTTTSSTTETTDSTTTSSATEATDSTTASSTTEATDSTTTSSTTETTDSTTTSSATEATDSTTASSTTEATDSTTASSTTEATDSTTASSATEATDSTTTFSATEATDSTTTFSATEATDSTTASSTTEATDSTTTSSTTEAIDSTMNYEVQSQGISGNKIETSTGYIAELNSLLENIKDIKSGIVKKGLSKDCKQSLKVSKENLERLEKQINAIKKSLTKQNNPEISTTDINRLNTFKNDIETIKEDIKSAVGGVPKNSRFFYGSIRDAEKSNKQQKKINQLQSKLKEAVKEGAILSIFNQEEQKAIDFYTRIAERRYTPEDYKLYKEHEGTFDPSFQKCEIELPIPDPSQIQTMGGISGIQEAIPTISGIPGVGQQVIQTISYSNINRGQSASQGGTQIEQLSQSTGQGKPRIDYSNMDIQETFQKGGIAGCIDKALSNCKNMTPGQRETRKSITVLAIYAGAIYGLFKYYTSGRKRREKAGITAAAIFGSQALTGEGPISLFTKAMTGGLSSDELQDKFGNSFGDAVTGISNSGTEFAPTLSGSMYSLMIFNSTTTIGDIRTMTNSFKDNNQWKAFRQNAIDKLKNNHGENCAQYFSTNFPDNFDEQKRNAWLASFGVTDSADDSKKIYELASNATMNEIILQKFKEENGLKENSNKIKKDELVDYMRRLKNGNKPLNIQTLKSHPEWFEIDKNATYTERQVDKDLKTNMENKIDSLPIDEPKKSELKTAFKRFYDERSIEAKQPIIDDFSLTMENDSLILTSHKGQKTKINIKTNEIDGFGRSIAFSDLSELLNIADLSNKIIDITKTKTPKGMPIFQSKTGTGGRGIYFNDADTRSFDFDTRVLSGGWGGTIGKIDTLGKNPNEYANYLSTRWIEINKGVTSTERSEDLDNKEKLRSQVDQLSLDVKKKSELKKAVESFYDGRTIENKPILNDFNLTMAGGFLMLKSHGGYETKIDINKKEIVGFGNGITFVDLSELLNVADLTNKILESQKGKVPVGNPPFQYKTPADIKNGVGLGGRGIYFNDAKWYNFINFDTRVLSAGWGGAMGKIDTLGKNPNEYADYLSKRWYEVNQVNLSSYPLTKQLKDDTELVFTDINEVKNVENLLETIKIQIGPIYSDQPKPFDIGYNISNPTKRYTLTFTYLKGESLTVETEDFEKKYPTIIENKDKFLNFLNNPINGMFKKQS